MSRTSTVIQRKREARGATLFLLLKVVGVIAFIGVAFALGGNPFTGEIPGETAGETPAEAPATVSE
ncbi:MAG: hypothetical protein AAFP13_05620 [Pseudomonadota bacterium]